MNGKMIVTNLRMKEENWLQVKAAAAEMGMSSNEYLNYLVNDTLTKYQLGVLDIYKKRTRKNKRSIWDLVKLAKIKNDPLGELSEEDKVIYGT